MKQQAIELIQTHHPAVQTVRDSTRELIVSIRKNDATDANRKDPDSCPVALACGRNGLKAMVYLTVVYIVDAATATRYVTSSAMKREIVRFDRSGKFSAGPYRLLPPPTSWRLLGHRPRRPKKAHAVRSAKRRRRATLGVRDYA